MRLLPTTIHRLDLTLIYILHALDHIHYQRLHSAPCRTEMLRECKVHYQTSEFLKSRKAKNEGKIILPLVTLLILGQLHDQDFLISIQLAITIFR